MATQTDYAIISPRGIAAWVSHWVARFEVSTQDILKSDDPEFAHQARVEVRKLRAVLWLALQLLPKGTVPKPGKDLRWLASCLGRARNWDVLIDETLPAVAAQISDSVLLQKAQAIRKTRYVSLRRALLSRRFHKLMASLTEFSLHASLVTDEDHSLINRTEKLLIRKDRQFRKAEKTMVHPDMSQLHRHRIEAKKLRYLAEFVSPLYRVRSSTNYIEKLARNQEVLGAINDLATTENILTKNIIVLEKQQKEFLLSAISARKKRLFKKMRKTVRRFKSAKPFFRQKNRQHHEPMKIDLP